MTAADIFNEYDRVTHNGRVVSVECPNCGVYRTVTEANVERCPHCGDDGWNLFDVEEHQP